MDDCSTERTFCRYFGTRQVLFLGVLPIAIAIAIAIPVPVAFSAVATVGACAPSIAHAGVLAVPFAFVNSVFRKHIA